MLVRKARPFDKQCPWCFCFDFCLSLDDRLVRSILTSDEPGEADRVGYVNVVDCYFDLNSENDEEK